MKLVHSLALVSALLLLAPVISRAAPAYYSPTASITTLQNFGLSSPLVVNAAVASVSNQGVTGTGFYNWASSCPGTADALFYVAPIPAVGSGCFVMVGFSPAALPGQIDLTKAGVKTGTDIAATLNAAISAITTSGKIVFPAGAGTYYLNSQIAAGAKNIEIDFNGATVLAHASFTGSMFKDDNTGKFVFRNGVIDCNYPTYTVSDGIGVYAPVGKAAPEFYNMTVTRCQTYGVQADGAVGALIIKGSTASYAGSTGWHATGVVGSIIVSDSNGSYSDIGGLFSATEKTDITGGEWHHNTTVNLLTYWGQNGASQSGPCSISNVTAHDVGAGGADIAIGQGMLGCTIVGNQLKSALTSNGINLNLDALLNDNVTPADIDVTVTGNVIGNLASDASSNPVRVSASIGGYIGGNTIFNESGTNGAVNVRQGSNKFVIGANTIIGAKGFVQVDPGTTTAQTTAIVAPQGNFGLAAGQAPVVTSVNGGTGMSGIALQPTSFLDASSCPGSSYPSLISRVVRIDNSAGNCTYRLPDTASVGYGQKIRIIALSSAHTVAVQAWPGSSDAIVNFGGSTTSEDDWAISGQGADYESTPGGWQRVVSWGGPLAITSVLNGGTGADLSATGGTSQVVKQVSTGAAFTVGQLAMSDINTSGTSSFGSVGNAGDVRIYSSSASGTGAFATLTADATNLGQLNIATGGGSAATVARVQIQGTVFPATDNSPSLGTGARRYAEIHIGTGTSQFDGPLLLPTAAATNTGDVNMCFKSDGTLRQGAVCGTSLEETKNIHGEGDPNYTPMSSLVADFMQLHPILFSFKGVGGERIGFGARATAKIDARLGAYDHAGKLYNVDDRAILALAVANGQRDHILINWLLCAVGFLALCVAVLGFALYRRPQLASD